MQGEVIFAAVWLILGKSTGNTLKASILIIFTDSFLSVNLVTLLFAAVKNRFILEPVIHFLLLFFSASGAKFLMYNSTALPDKLKYISPVYWLSTWMLELSEKTPLYIYILVFTAVFAAGTAALLGFRRIFLTRAGKKVLK